MIHKNVATDFCATVYDPAVDSTAYVHPLAAVIGNVIIGKRVMVSPFASVRGDEGQPLHVGDESNVQDGVIIHALETEHNGHAIEQNLVEAEGKKYAVYIGKRVSLAHQVQIHGPAYVGNDTFVGMKVLVFKAKVGNNCVVEPGCVLMGVTVPDGRYVPAGTTLTKQEEADKLPVITDSYPMKDLNKGVIHVNTHLADGYNKAGIK
ncbi:MAG TPA: carbonic anhydrase [Spirochaetota bacterium]|nr:carbonic anhydrase [Spirochaetota bacterium]HPF05591.1 carbonic anhydrase [Spirochaetota bacterium]HPJ43555.1 carbonic anhydrase [Spirochaetota bacterium]HPR36537.1 carbonic anhydrase [Spirochaetota bacterium]HRX47036.1 carbonic anhydrase [Spirochaetota bacterium]